MNQLITTLIGMSVIILMGTALAIIFCIFIKLFKLFVSQKKEE